MPHLEISEIVFVHCNIANNNRQQNLRLLYICFPNKILYFSKPLT